MTSPIQVEDNSAHLLVVVNKILDIIYDECKPIETFDIIANVTAAILAASQPSLSDRFNALLSINETIRIILNNSSDYHTVEQSTLEKVH